MQQRLGREGLTLEQGGAGGGGRAEGEGGQRCHGGGDGELTLQEARGQRFVQVLVLL